MSYFLPIMATYAGEIRMYSWSCVFITLMAVYGYRLYINTNNKNLITFGIFSICSCYIHYYALLTALLINLILLTIFIKNRKNDKSILSKFLILSAIQIILYLPWCIYLLGQIRHVSSGFWIKIEPVRTTVEMLSFQFNRMLDTNFSFTPNIIAALFISLVMYIYIIYKIYILRKQKENIKPAIISFIMYILVILVALIISIKMKILYARYLIVITPFYILGIAYILSLEKNKIIYTIVCISIVTISIITNMQTIIINYDISNNSFYEYINKEIKEDDIIISSNIGALGVSSIYFPNNKQYFISNRYFYRRRCI